MMKLLADETREGVGSGRVLICEDDPVQLTVLSRAFETNGYAPLEARNQTEAVAHLQRTPVDAIVADVQLENGNAFGLAKALGRIDLDIPMVLVSANATSQTRERALRIGAAGFFDKPLDPQRLVEHIRNLKASRARHAAGRVLIVEDHPSVLGFLRGVLANAGFETLVAMEGAEALRLIRTLPPVDIVLMDMHVPGISGAALVAALRAALPGLAVIMLTGEAEPEEIQAGYRAGAEALVFKPIVPDRLASFMREEAAKAREKRIDDSKRMSLSWCRRAVQWVRRRLAGARRRERLITLALYVGAAAAGLLIADMAESVQKTLGSCLERVDRITDIAEQKMANAQGVDAEFQRWYMLQKLDIDRQSAETTRRHYEWEYSRQHNQEIGLQP